MKKFLYLFSFLLAITFTACESGQPEGPSGDPNVPENPSNPDEPSEPNKHENHDWVDLGLSVKWATCNVGANAPEEFGDYFAWGETKPKSVYDWNTYKWYNSSSGTLTKYTGSMNDNKWVLDLEDDAAHVNWGGAWRMPTEAEVSELIEKCTWIWTTQNGVNGCKVTSKTNGNSIFLPAAGSRSYSDFCNVGSTGFYLSSSLYTSDSYNAYFLHFYSGNAMRDYINRGDYAHTVRPVVRE